MSKQISVKMSIFDKKCQFGVKEISTPVLWWSYTHLVMGLFFLLLLFCCCFVVVDVVLLLLCWREMLDFAVGDRMLVKIGNG